MSVQNYIGWASHVNRTILDATTVSIGENALRTDELENGFKQSVQRSAYVPERYSVKMSFDWDNPNWEGTGKTEYQLFTEWYKYQHKCGVVPFEFPNIAYSTNTGIPQLDPLSNEVVYNEYYKITSATEGAKSGGHIAVTMTWEAVYTGTVSISNPSIQQSDIRLDAHNTYLDVIFSTLGNSVPASSNFTLYRKASSNDSFSQISMTGFAFDGISTARLYHDSYDTGYYSIALNYSGYSESVGTHVSP